MVPPQTPAGLAEHDLIHYVSRLGSKSEGFEHGESGEYRTLAMSGPVVVNNSDAYNAACFAGFECTEWQAFEFDSGYSTVGPKLPEGYPHGI